MSTDSSGPSYGRDEHLERDEHGRVIRRTVAVTGHSLCRTQQQMIWYFKMVLSIGVVAICFVLLLLGHLGVFRDDSDFVPVYTGIVGFVLGSWFGHGQVEQHEQQQEAGDHHV